MTSEEGEAADLLAFEKYRAARERFDQHMTLDNMRAVRAALFEFYDLYAGPMSLDQAKASLGKALEFPGRK